MRRQDRYILTGMAIGTGAIAIADILLQWIEHQNTYRDFTWDSFDGGRTLTRSLGGAFVGGVLGNGYYQYRIAQESESAFNADQYLERTLMTEHVKADPVAFNKVVKYRDSVKQRLAKRFSNKLVSPPEDTGSFYKRTAIASNYDLDIVLPFSRNSYNTLEGMYEDVYAAVYKDFGASAEITRKTRAIGVSFDSKGIQICFDIVPGREIRSYSRDKELNLFVRPDWMWQNGTSFKTNIGIQKKMTTHQSEARKVIKLVKIYRDRNGITLPTLIIEQCVVTAMKKGNFGMFNSLTGNFINCLEVIARKIEQDKIIDAANSNNNLNAKMSGTERSIIADQLLNDIDRIEENIHYLVEIMEH